MKFCPMSGKRSPDQNGGVKLRFQQNLGNHGGAGGLSVGAGHPDRASVAAQNPPQENGTLHHRDAKLLCLKQLGIVGRDGGRIHHEVGPLHLRLFVSKVNRDPVVAKVLYRRGLAVVRPRHTVPAQTHDFRKGRHAHAADADKMNVLISLRQIVYPVHKGTSSSQRLS